VTEKRNRYKFGVGKAEVIRPVIYSWAVTERVRFLVSCKLTLWVKPLLKFSLDRFYCKPLITNFIKRIYDRSSRLRGLVQARRGEFLSPKRVLGRGILAPETTSPMLPVKHVMTVCDLLPVNEWSDECIALLYQFVRGNAMAQLVESAGRGFNSRWCHWNFLLT
jgi:hypothetical protein